MKSDVIQFVMPVALKDIFDVIAPEVSTRWADQFDVALMLNPEVPGYIAGGAAWSVAASNPVYILQVLDLAECAAGLINLGYSPLAFGVRGEDAPKPLRALSEIESLLHSAERIAFTGQGTSGVQFHQLMEQLQEPAALAEKLVPLPGGAPMAQLLSGEVDVAVLPLSNIAPVPGVYAKAVCPHGLNVHIDLAFCLNKAANAATHRFADWLIDARDRGRLDPLGLWQAPNGSST
ncbi:MAG: substrate-binding domain-containing protein [Pseudomonadota bacterium]